MDMNRSDEITYRALQNLHNVLLTRDVCADIKEEVDETEFLIEEAKIESKDYSELEQNLTTLKLMLRESVLTFRKFRIQTITSLELALQELVSEKNKAKVRNALKILEKLENPFDMPEPYSPNSPSQKSSIPAPPKISRIPAPQASSRIPTPSAPSQVPTTSRIPVPPPTRPLTSKMPQPSQRHKPLLTQVTNNAAKVQQDIKNHQMKKQQAQQIRKMGNFGNLKRDAEIKKQPRMIPQKEVKEREEGLKVMLDAAKTVGTFKKRAAQPVPQSSCNLLFKSDEMIIIKTFNYSRNKRPPTSKRSQKIGRSAC